MFFGFLISFLAFGGLAFFLSRLSLRIGYERDSRVLAVFFYFLIPMLALSLVTLVMVALYSLLGFSVSVAAEALARSLSADTSGVIALIGGIITLIFGLTAIAAGPATAFTASQVSTLVAAITVAVQKDEEFCQRWLPWVAFATYGFCMWPFAALFTFGL